MACLSVSRDGSSSLVVAANPIYLTAQLPEGAGSITFEVLEADLSFLDSLVGEAAYFALGSEFGGWGVLRDLHPMAASTVPGLARLRDQSTYFGRIEVFAEAAPRQ